ncbi:MAG: TonB-dependent receptor domain-containing protein [Bacteroidia bacterium]
MKIALKVTPSFRSMALVLGLLFSFASLAQTGTITGSITDKVDGSAIIGAVISIDTLNVGVASDFDGKYQLRVKPGTYTVKCQFSGYQTLIIGQVKVENGKKTPLDFPIATKSSFVNGDSTGVIIYGERPTNTTAKVLDDIKNGNVVADGMPEQEIKKLPQGGDAGQVARRIPGVTLVDNRFIIVRGLSERYNAVLLNNVFAPSVESDVKSFSFDLIPSSMIDRFLVFKSPSADLPGEFSGGAVRIYTRNIPDKTSFQVGYSSGFRSETTFQQFNLNKGTSSDLYGMGAASRALPAGFVSNVRNLSNDPDGTRAAGQSLRNDWGYKTFDAPLDHRFNLNYALRLSDDSLGRWQFGNITSLNYSNTYTTVASDRLDYNSYNAQTGESDTVFYYNDKIYTNRVRLSLVQNNAIRFGKNGSQKIELKNIVNQLGDNETTFRGGRNMEQGEYRQDYSYRYTQRTIYSGQVLGAHEFNQERTKFDWTLAYSFARRKDPDWRRVRMSKSFTAQPEDSYQLYLPFSAQPFFLGRLFMEMNEDIAAASGNWEQKITLGDSSNPYEFSIKSGFYVEEKTRSFQVRNLGYAIANVSQFDWNLLNAPLSEVFDPQNINSTTGIRIDEDTKKADSYLASNSLQAAYFMAVLPFGSFHGKTDDKKHERVRFAAGVRAEHNVQRLNGNTIPGDTVIVNNDILSILPSGSLVLNLSDRTLLRASYGKTINRPEFREIAPFYFYDFNFNSINSGNDSLQNCTVDNFDFRYEFYPRSGENITVGLFYKKFTNPIEMYFVPGVGSGGTRSFTWGNAAQAESWGAEIELRKKFDNIDVPVIRNLGVTANAAYIYSSISLNADSLNASTQKRPMMGQSPYVINGGLFWQNDSTGWSINALYNVVGPRVVIVGIPGIPEVYEMPRHQIDFMIEKTFGARRNIDLRFSVSDLLNQNFMLLQDANTDGKLDPEVDQQMQTFKRGTYFMFGLNIRLLEKRSI